MPNTEEERGKEKVQDEGLVLESKKKKRMMI